MHSYINKKFEEHRICFRINQFIERYLGIKSFATKITLMFLSIFVISLLIATGIFSILNVRNLMTESQNNIKLATKIRKDLAQNKLNSFYEKIKIMVDRGYTDELKNLSYVKNFYQADEVDAKEIYRLSGNILKIKVDGLIVDVEKEFLDNVIKIKGGVISKYNPYFELGEIKDDGLICAKEKFKDSNFYLTGCIEKSTITKIAILQSLRESFIFLVTLSVVFFSVYSLIKRVLIFPLRFLTLKLSEIEIKGVEKVKFNLHKFGEDEIAYISKTLEDFRKSIVKNQVKMRLIFETVNKMISMSNNIHGFGLFVLNQLDKILDLEGSLIVITSIGSEKDEIIRSNRFLKSNKNFPKEIIEKIKYSNETILDSEKVVVIKKSVDKDIEVIFIGFSKSDLSEEDRKYLEIILSDFVYILNINNLATQDYLTKLPNRRKLISELNRLIEISKRYKKPLSVLMLDVDDFKAINDTYGHDAGDIVLINISKILTESLRQSDFVGRYGGEEFLIILPNTDENSALYVAEKIRKSIELFDFSLNENTNSRIKLTVSIGVASLYKHGESGDDLIKAADICLYRAKREGKNKVVTLPAEEISIVIKTEFEAKNIITKAIEEDRLIPFYQPIVNSNTKEIVGYEVLARIYDSENDKYISAYIFINDALKYGLGNKIDRIIQEKAIKYLSDKVKKDNKLIFFNLSRVFLYNSENLDNLYNLLRNKGINPNQIVLEITEEEAITDIVKVKEMIRYGKYLGFKFAIDDFGAGYSNFIYLKHFDIDIVKIDGSLISNIDKDADDRIIVESIVKIAHYKGIKTLAEMVETQQEFETLKDIGIDYIQGYFISKPLKEI